MVVESVVVVAACFVAAALATGAIRAWALRNGMMDIPNHRSSHSAPTPRGGGLAIVGAAVAAWGWLYFRHAISPGLFLALIGGGGAVAGVGYVDDRRPVPAGIRLFVHLAAAAWALYCLGGMPSLTGLGMQSVPGWILQVVGVSSIVWAINLFNFMDGIDGIAASEAVFVAGAGAILCLLTGVAGGAMATSVLLAVAVFGFLLWNWPPAKIFMGDVGSGFLGFVIAVITLAATEQVPVMLPAWLVLGGAFFVDATVTLVRRFLRRERVYEAHRSHAYQWLARRWGSHRKVTLSVLAVNVLWLFPLAWLATRFPTAAHWIVVVALLPLVVVALVAGAGRPE